MLGQRFGRLVVLSRANHPDSTHKYYLCKCDCSNEIIVRGSSLRSFASKSCGCVQTIHKMYGTSTYISWCNMIQRCTNSNSTGYINYGGRGITICERWLDFRNFYKDMGDKPENRSLDRINNDGNYEPSNCRWATPYEQTNNRRLVTKGTI